MEEQHNCFAVWVPILFFVGISNESQIEFFTGQDTSTWPTDYAGKVFQTLAVTTS